MFRFCLQLFALFAIACAHIFSPPCMAQTPPGYVLLEQLRQGGLVIYLRHMPATIGEDQFDKKYWEKCEWQRNLTSEGRVQARQLGHVLSGLSIPIDRIITGELCRANETGKLLNVGTVIIDSGLNDYMTWTRQGGKPDDLLVGYRKKLSTQPIIGKNTILVSHAQRGKYAAHISLDLIEMGSAAIFRPDGSGGFELVAMLRQRDWGYLGLAEIPN
jgi:phosphohistidine phosphatase SixA